MRTLLVLTGLTLAMAACSGSTPLYGQEDSGRELNLDAGDRFEIRLQSNPSTGYSWEIADAADLPVELRSRRHEPADTDAIGAPGEDVLEFEATEGAGVLRLEYIRTFDEPAIPEGVVEYIIRVDGASWPPEGVTPPGTATQSAPINVSELSGSSVQGSVAVSGYFVSTGDVARLCEALAESFPPQCGGGSVVIANPEAMIEETQQEQTTRWTDVPILVEGTFDGTQLVIE